MQIIYTSLQTDNHATSSLSFYRPDALPVAQSTASTASSSFITSECRRRIEAPKEPSRKGVGRGCPPPYRRKGLCPPQKIFPIFELKKASFDASWVLFLPLINLN